MEDLSSESNWRHKIAEILVIGAMPLLYGAATRLPFIYFVIHLTTIFEVEWAKIGLYVGCYQGARVVTSAVAISAPKLSHLLGTTAGLLGYLIVYVSDKSSLTHFVAGTAMVGFSETMSSMQKYGKEMYKFDPNRKKTQLRIKFQYAFVMIGVVVAFGLGGFIYENRGINGVALFGIILELSALLVLFAFWSLQYTAMNQDVKEETLDFPIKTSDGNEAVKHMDLISEEDKNVENSNEKDEEEGSNDMKISFIKDEDGKKSNAAGVEGDAEHIHTSVTFQEESRSKVTFLPQDENKISFLGGDMSSSPMKQGGAKHDQDGNSSTRFSHNSRLSHFRRSVFSIFRLSSLLDAANANYSAAELPATWINWLLCATFGVEALTIGYTLGIGPIFLLNEFDQKTGVVGALFAIGGIFGTVAAIGITCTESGNNLMRKIASSPFDLCFAMGGIATGVLLATIPSLIPHAIGLILLMAFNDVGATLMTELQASITTASNFAILGPVGQVVRRCLNVVTAVTGPILFGIYPRLPYLIAGGTTLAWTIMLFIIFKIRMEKTYEKVSKKTGRNAKSLKYRMSFATSEVVHAMAKNHKTTAEMNNNAAN